jgi:signal transduction histidine kinase/AmiR/NasT family two-component response regulator
MASEQASAVTPEPSKGPGAKQASILVVDDRQENLLALEATLRFLGQNIVKANSGREALRLLLDQDFAVILLDVHMPEMDGFETASLIRNRERSQNTPIIFLTAMHKGQGQVFKGYSLGAVDYIFKPFEPEILKAKVAVFIELYKKTEEISRQADLLRAKNEELDRTNSSVVELYRQIEKKNDELEERVQERTAQLAKTNLALQAEVAERRKAEEERTRLLVREQRAREEAERANRAKDEFLATVSHELRTPLTAILGWTRLLRTKLPDEASKHRGLETIERNARSQAKLIEDILDVSRIISGKLRLEIRQVRLTSIAEAAIDAVRPAVEAKGLNLQLRLQSDPGVLRGDPNRLQQIVWNLLSNAVKFTPNGGAIIVELEHTGRHARVRISDTGVGINAEFLPMVFDRFTQAERHMTGKHGGLGLGLAIVRHLVEMHGGTIRVDSAGEGQGATFTVEFPSVAGAGADRLLDVYSEDLSQGERGWEGLGALCDLRIMVVDDDPDTLQMLTIALEEAGGEVKAFASVSDALEVLEQWRADVVISDLGMPDEDGYALVRRMRSMDSQTDAAIPAIALTAFASIADRTRALEAGFQKHVSKPVEPLELVNIVAQLARSPGTQGKRMSGRGG